jgi:hypothetical protein
MILQFDNIVTYSPHVRVVEAQKPRGTRLRNSGALPSRVLHPHPSPRYAPYRSLLGYAFNTGSRNSMEGPRDLRDVTRNNTQRCLLPHLRLRHLQERLKAVHFSTSQYEAVQLEVVLS